MDPNKVVVIINIPSPTLLWELHATLVQTRYYQKFMHNYATITTPLEKLLKKETQYVCT